MSGDGQDSGEAVRRPLVLEAASGTLRARVDGALRQVAGERGLLFDPLPAAAPSAVVRLVDGVEDLAAGLGAQGRRWLAAGLAVLSEDLEATADPAGRDPRLWSAPATAVGWWPDR
jgi:hypothetical protein